MSYKMKESHQKLLWAILVFLIALLSGCNGNDDSKNNLPPAAYFTASKAEGAVPLAVKFDASGSTDQDGTISVYSWSFGDGGMRTGIEVEHTFTSTGDFTVLLTVIDDDGAQGQYSKVIKTYPSDKITLLNKVKFWAYQLQEIQYPTAEEVLIDSKYDMLVLEPIRTDWSDDGTRRYDTKNLVTRLKASKAHNGTDRKLVIGYVDIAEAEDWRWYWIEKGWPVWKQGRPRPPGLPEWILSQDPDGWAGDFPVAYWNSQWQDIMIYGANTGTHPDRDYFSAVDELIIDGFDGIYMDWVEAYEDEAVIAEAQKDGLDPAEEMVKFISRIRQYARERNPDFLIIQQNGSSLLSGQPQLLQVIDAIAQEGIWYENLSDMDWDDPEGYDQPTDPGQTAELLINLKAFKNAGIPVFCCEYALVRASTAYEKASVNGLIGYCSRSSLSKLTTTPPPGY
jgi:cysteinyl-tRNA synthetase